MKKLLIFFLVSSFLSGCATFMNGRNKNINIMTSTGEEATVDVISSTGVQTVNIPAVITVKRANHPITINVKETKCYRPSTNITSERVSMWVLGDIPFYIFGLTGTTTDASTGAMWNYDDNVIVPLYKKTSCKKN